MMVTIWKPENGKELHEEAKDLAKQKGESFSGMVWRLIQKEINEAQRGDNPDNGRCEELRKDRTQ